jgi:lysozyme
MMNIDQLVIDLERDESFRPYLYDDSTGEALRKGHHIFGNPTVGIGWCPSTRLCEHELAVMICRYQAEDTWNELLKVFPWMISLPEPIQRAVCNMAFNLGVVGFEKFNTFIDLIKAGRYQEASEDLKGTLWARQVKSRATRIEGLINAQHV